MGDSPLPALAAAPHAGSLEPGLIEIRPFTHPAPSRSISLVWRDGCPLEPTFQALATYIRNHVPDTLVRLN